MANWISVDERLPPDMREVLATDGHQVYPVNYDAYFECWYGHSHTFYDEEHKITHWMPLPDLPNAN